MKLLKFVLDDIDRAFKASFFIGLSYITMGFTIIFDASFSLWLIIYVPREVQLMFVEARFISVFLFLFVCLPLSFWRWSRVNGRKNRDDNRF